MNKITNESGIEVVAVGYEGSHVRNFDMYNVTMPKLIDTLLSNWSIGIVDESKCRQDLYAIMESANIPKEKHNSLYKTAYFYFEQELETT
jgi:hypothetical protein